MSIKNQMNPAQTASPSQPLTGADVVVLSLIHHEVDTVFAYPGGAVIPLHQAYSRYEDKLRIVLPRHEQGGGFAAQGYARSTGKVGVCSATSGPGAANLLTAIADAKMDSIPLVAITGQVGSNVIGTDAFQEMPSTEVFRSITKHHMLIMDPNDIVRGIREAFYIANSGRKGPVLVDIPKNVFLAQVGQPFQSEKGVTIFEEPDFDCELNLPGYGEKEMPTPEEEAIAQWVELIRSAKKPAFYIGGGAIASDASEEILKLVEKTGIPAASTLTGLGAFPAEHPLALGLLGMHGSCAANKMVHECDLLMVLGARFSDRVTGNAKRFAPNAKIVHVDIDLSEIRKIIDPALAVTGDLREVLEKLNAALLPMQMPDITPWVEQVKEWKQRLGISYRKDSKNILPQQALEKLYEMTKDQDPIVATGVGQHQMWTAQFFKINSPKHWLSSCGAGTMGFGLPAGMGAKIANPDKMVIVVEGDGSLLMNIQEMGCCFCEKIPVKVLLLNNQYLGMVFQWEDRFCRKNHAQTFLGPIDDPEKYLEKKDYCPTNRYPDFTAIAKGFGWNARTVIDPAELESALQEMIDAEGPYLLDVAIPYSEQVIPMIPAGGTFSDMIRE